MSRRARRRRSQVITSPSAIPSRSLSFSLPRQVTRPAPIRLVEDRRTYHPLGYFRPARTISGHPVGPVVVTKNRSTKNQARPFLAKGLSFALPKKTLICVRRKTRKEVLHALKKVGKGKSGGRRRRNWYSNIGC